MEAGTSRKVAQGPWFYSKRAELDSRFRLVSMCMVQTRKIIAPSIENASGHTTNGWRTTEVVSPATEQNRSAPIALRKPVSRRKDWRPMTQATTRAATATNPRIRGAIMLISTNQAGSRHASYMKGLLARAGRQLARELHGGYFFASRCILAGPQGREISGARGLCFRPQRCHCRRG